MTREEKKLRQWLEEELREINDTIARLEGRLSYLENLGEKKPLYQGFTPGLIKPSWIRVLKMLHDDFEGRATSEALSKKLDIRKSVASGYLNRLKEYGLVRRKYNHTKMSGRYLFVLTKQGELFLQSLRAQRN